MSKKIDRRIMKSPNTRHSRVPSLPPTALQPFRWLTSRFPETKQGERELPHEDMELTTIKPMPEKSPHQTIEIGEIRLITIFFGP